MLVSKFDLSQRGGSRSEEEEEEEKSVTKPSTTVTESIESAGEQEVQKYRVLKKSQASVNLSWLGITASGDGYAYLKLSLVDMDLVNIKAMACFDQLQFVDVSKNYLTLDALQVVTRLPFLLLLQADKNRVRYPYLNKCKYLQVIIMNDNKMLEVEKLFQPHLRTFEATNNEIHRMQFINRMSELENLDLSHNYISEIGMMDFPNLRYLYLSSNKIKNVTGLHQLPNLEKLYLRNNPIRVLHGFDEPFPKLKYLNLRNCRVRTLLQVKRLRAQKTIETLILKGTPYMGGTGMEKDEPSEDDPEIRVTTIAALQFLHRLNKDVITEEERQEANEIVMQWQEEGENDEEEEVEEEMLPEEYVSPEFPGEMQELGVFEEEEPED